MYPATYYENFMRYEPSNEVFVAMPFSSTFQDAFDKVIEPAINRIQIKGVQLNAKIINRGTTGSPDIHEKIFDAIIHSRLVIADMTVQASHSTDNGGIRWQANANVAYEVGLASAWRNPEDILLINQSHEGHSYSFDVQNLRHFEYFPNDKLSVELLSQEILSAINQSSFLAKQAFLKTLQSVSPSAVHLLHQEAQRAFPMLVFRDNKMGILDTRVHAITELLNCGAVKNRHVIPQNPGMIVIYQWTELGLRMLMSLHAITLERKLEIAGQIASVPDSQVPPPELLKVPDEQAEEGTEKPPIDMIEATELDDTDAAKSSD